jgi:general secretion pathway protein G
MCTMQNHLEPGDRRPHVTPPGFTWVEVLAVCLILFLLFAMVRSHVSNHAVVAHIRDPIPAVHLVLGYIKSALDQYRADTGNYPAGTNGLLALLQPPTVVTNWHGPYLEKIPIDPWGHKYVYEDPGKHASSGLLYDLYSPGPAGPAGVIGNWQ